MNEAAFSIIAQAIQNANLDYPNTESGTQWDQHVRSNEESRHLAHAVLKALELAGYVVEPKKA